MKRVEFFYDFACPYAYLGHTQIEALCERAGAELVWRPFLLGGVFRSIGAPDVPMASMPAAKARLNALDMMRWAARFGVPLEVPATHPNRTVLALRAAIASGDLPRASRALFHAYWVLAEDVSQPDVVARALDEVGLDGAVSVARASDPAVKEDLRARTDAAIAAGVFGAPAFVVTRAPGAPAELFWGQDRLELVEEALTGKHVAEPLQARAGGAPELLFYFDFSSPFAYLGATQVERVAAAAGAWLVYRPLLLGALFRKIGTPNVPLLAAAPAKQRHYAEDMQRWARRWGVPLRFPPSRFPMNTVKALRMLLALPEDERGRLVLPMFRAYWADDRDLASDEVLVDVASQAGLDGPALLAASSEPDVKARLWEATDDAEARGLCGVPTFGVGDELIWGQDRFWFVERALRGKGTSRA